MTAADQIAEINRQHDERVKLLERERDAKIAMVRGRCKHSRSWHKYWQPLYGPQRIYSVKCRHCGLEY